MHSFMSAVNFSKQGLWFYSNELAAVQCGHLREAGRDAICTVLFFFSFFFSTDALPLSSMGMCVTFFFIFHERGDLSKVREEGDGKSSVLQHHHIKLHRALH